MNNNKPSSQGQGLAIRTATRFSLLTTIQCVALSTAVLAWGPIVAQAVPSFARQLDMQCTACHTSFPMLNQFGRTFKLTGYTASAETTNLPPLAAMLMPSFTHTSESQPGGAAPGFSANNNAALTQASVFYAGRLFGPYAKSLFGSEGAALANKFGVFAQVTYDGIGKSWKWDNTEFRFADKTEFRDHDVVYGVYLNNNPTLQDPWNSTPAFGYPFTGSGLAPTPSAATQLEGGFSQQVAGLGAYAMVDDRFYFDLGGYHTLPAHFQKALGSDPSGQAQISGLAPYWRLAYERPVGEGRWEFGTLGLATSTYPGHDTSAGSDRVIDYGLDTQYQLPTTHGDFAAMASWIHEQQRWHAGSTLGNTANTSDSLDSFKLTASYLHDKTYGLTVQYFAITGSTDAVLNSGSANGSPASNGYIFQADYLPLNKGVGPKFWPRSNVKLTVQYRYYNKFNGGRDNFDGNGAKASDNNTLYLEAWILF